jgi:DNA-binding NarL/FixJ family response regulator
VLWLKHPLWKKKTLTDSPEDQSIPLLDRLEIMILSCLSNGLSTKETADQIHLSQETIRRYMRISQGKLNAKNATQAVANAIRKKLIK